MKPLLNYNLLIIVALFSLPSAASAESANASFHEGALVQFGATPVLLFSFNDFCTRDLDVVSCSDMLVLAGFQIDASYRLPLQWLALGIVGGSGFELNAEKTCSSDGGCKKVPSAHLWRIGMEALFYPLLTKRIAIFLAIEGGIGGAGGRAFTDVAPQCGAAIGFDLPIGRHFFIGADFRGNFYGFGNASNTTPDGNKLQLSNSVFSSLGLLKLGAYFPLS